LVDERKFPDMISLVHYGHTHGLKVGSYLNNCICMEGGDPPMGTHCSGATHYQQDVDFILSMGFDEVKLDNCGSSHNVTRWAELLNSSGKAIRIESCHTFHPNHHTPSSWPNFPVWDPATKAADAHCPMNMYRTGGDISPNFDSIIGEAYATVQYNDRPDPFSHPGCWAYPDMSEIGQFSGRDPLRTDEERTHWGLWCIISSPLILSVDMSQTDIMDRIWTTITNQDALYINDAWAGMPGTLVKSYLATDSSVPFSVDQAECDGSPQTLGWVLKDKRLLAPHCPFCLDTTNSLTGQCPPPTRRFKFSSCGNLFINCSRVTGTWEHDNTTGLLRWHSKLLSGPPKCLTAKPPAPVGGFYGGPVAASTTLGACPWGARKIPKISSFSFTAKGELRTASGMCLVARRLYGAQLWSKPLPGGKVAVLVINMLEQHQTFDMPLADVPDINCSSDCIVRDVWKRQERLHHAPYLHMQLRGHESAFFIISRSSDVGETPLNV